MDNILPTSVTTSGEEMKKRQKGVTGILGNKDRETYQWELGLEQERIRRKRSSDALKEYEKREALEKAGQGNLFTTEKGGGLS